MLKGNSICKGSDNNVSYNSGVVVGERGLSVDSPWGFVARQPFIGFLSSVANLELSRELVCARFLFSFHEKCGGEITLKNVITKKYLLIFVRY